VAIAAQVVTWIPRGKEKAMEIGGRFPRIGATDPATGSPVRLTRGGREAYAVVIPPAEWDERSALPPVPAGEELSSWDAHLLVGGPDARRAAGIADDRWGLVVLDRYLTVHRIETAGEPEDLPDASEIESALRFLALQCPECDVPDWPVTGADM
jgi:hypothetical protein